MRFEKVKEQVYLIILHKGPITYPAIREEIDPYNILSATYDLSSAIRELLDDSVILFTPASGGRGTYKVNQ